MDHMKRCPQCFLTPAVSFEDGGLVVLQCSNHHGHMAMGSTMDMAIKHWNIYVEFVRREALLCIGENGPGKTSESHCVNCNRLTETLVTYTKDLYRAECRVCHLPKVSRGAA